MTKFLSFFEDLSSIISYSAFSDARLQSYFKSNAEFRLGFFFIPVNLVTILKKYIVRNIL